MPGPEDLDPRLTSETCDGALPFELDRRQFFKALGGGLLVLLCRDGSTAQELQSGRPQRGREPPPQVSAWLHVGANERVTVYTGKVEMGQNIRTSLAQQVAEELRVPLDALELVMGDTHLVPWDAGTFGSRTTPYMGPQLRAAAAAARKLLLDLAAKRWKTDASHLVASGGRVEDPRTGEKLSYGELTRGEELVELIGEPTLASPSAWSVAGSRAGRVNARDLVTGRHRFVSDLERPQMLYGRILRPAGFEAKLLRLSTARARRERAAQIVREGDFVGVAARTPWAAEATAKTLEASWRVPDQPSHRQLLEHLKKNADPEPGFQHRIGSAEEALATAETKLERTYTVEFIAHAPLEPRAAVAEWRDGTLTVWTATQRPFAVRDELAAAFRVPSEKVRVIVPDSGAAYGGKHTGETAVEAARLAKAATRPVKVVWTREEEFTWAYFRPAGLLEVRSGARRDGTLTAWEFHNYNSGPAGIRTPYEVANQRIEFHPLRRPPLRQGSYRALAATANHFARETHMDEVAAGLGIDPLRFRLKNLADERLRAVFEAAGERAGWGARKDGAARALGIAGGVEKGGYVAACAEVAAAPGGELRVRRIVQAFECGAVVNPDGLRNQIEGAIVQGLGGALFEAVRFEKGRILNPRFSKYRVPRFSDVPAIDVVLLDRKDLPPAGAGETPIVAVAPAVANAIFAATGVRLRSLPLLGKRRVDK